MKLLSRKCCTEMTVPVQIPPLKLPDVNFDESPIRPNKSKDRIAFLKATPLDQNVDFLREKSLYRYAISRKGSKQILNKSQANLLSIKSKLNKTEQRMARSPSGDSKYNKQFSIISTASKEANSKSRHFRRKSRYETEMESSQFLNKTPVNSTDIDPKSQTSESNKKIELLLQSQSTAQFNSDNEIQREIEQLKLELQELKDENKHLKDSYQHKCRQLQLFEIKLSTISLEKDRLLDEVRKNCKIYSDSFINQTKLQNQLIFRDNLIIQLQEKLKYLELENITLKKSKGDRIRQQDLIMKLEKKNKHLEEKIKILSRMKTKRSRLGSSMVSDFSDLSLNLSVDEEDIEKMYPELKTAEKTPEKKSIKNKYSVQPPSAPSTPVWKVKARK